MYGGNWERGFLEIHAALCQIPSSRYFLFFPAQSAPMFSSPLDHSGLAQCFLTPKSPASRVTQAGAEENQEESAEGKGEGGRRGAGGEAGPYRACQWFQASAGARCPCLRLRRREHLRHGEAALGPSGERLGDIPLRFRPFECPAQKGMSQAVPGSGQSVDDLWRRVWGAPRVYLHDLGSLLQSSSRACSSRRCAQ